MLKPILLALSLIVTQVSAKEIYIAPPSEEITTFGMTMQELVDFYADKHGVDKTIMHKTVKCESSYNPNAVGDGGNSYGLSQIHIPSWGGEITKEQALDPRFALDFMGKKLSEGRGKLWTCYRMLNPV